MSQQAAVAVSPLQAPPVRVALAGNPNCGKTSLFNAMTGAHGHVGNYPGVTVEKRTGAAAHAGRRLAVHDLPGTYSLTSYSPEERIASQELLSGAHEVVVVVADSTNLKRGLVLLAQVMQAGANPVLCLNFADEAAAAGQRIDVAQMRLLLGFPVVETVGHRGGGVGALLDAVLEAAGRPAGRARLVLGERLEGALELIAAHLGDAPFPAAGRNWVASRLLVGDAAAADSAWGNAGDEAVRQRARLEAETGLDIALFVTERYYGFVDGLLREVVRSPQRADARAVSDRIDRVLAHRVWGLPLFGAAMYALFWLTFSVGEVPMGWIEAGVALLGEAVSSLWPAGSASPLRSLLVDGVLGGVGGVVVFLPNILLLFLGLALLEDTGYLSRAAFLMDGVMHRFGLHGRSFVPLLTGFGCSIPGIMATRTLENERDRLATMLVLPLMSCGARLPIWMLLVPAFFAAPWRAPVLFGIYLAGIVLALGLALLLRRSLLRGEEAPFVMELPPYRLPTARAVGSRMVERASLYLRKAGTVILAISVLMWAATSYPKAGSYRVDAEVAGGAILLTSEQIEHARAAEDLEASVAGRVGGALEPIMAPLGFDRRLTTALLGAFAAKEVFVAQMGIVYALGETGSVSLRERLAGDYSPLVALSLMLFLLIGTPCMATVAVTRRESGSWRWAALQFGGLTVVAWVLSLLVYQTGRLLG